MKPKFSHAAPLGIACLSLGASLHAQTVWDGNGNANASGNWSSNPSFWSPDGAPSAVAVELNNVTAGTRTVTLDTAASVVSLALNQATVNGVNALALTTAGQDLTITDASGFTMTNSTGQVGAISLALSGGDIRLTSTATSTVSLNSTVSLSNGSRFVTSNSGVSASYNIDGDFSMVGGGGNGSPGLFVGNGVGNFNVAASGSVTVSGGLGIFGRATSGSTNRGQTLNNAGEVTIENGGTLRLDSAQSFEQSDYNNSGTTILGNAVTAGQAILDLDTNTGSSGGVGRFDNLGTGELFVYGSSHIDLGNRSDASANAIFTNADGGEVTFAGDATGAGIRSSFAGGDQVYATVTNAGALTVTNHASVSRGLGVITHAGRAARLDVTNAATGVFTVQQSADLAISTTNSGTGPKTLAVANAGTMVIGNGAADTANGSSVTLAARGTSDTATAAAVSFANTGNLRLEGASVLQLATDSVMTSWTFTNGAAGTTELNRASTLGNASTALTWTNAGLFRKTGTGTAGVLSSAGGSNSNSGDLQVNGGTLQFGLGLSSNTGTITVGAGAALTVGGSGLNVTSGTVTGNGAINGSTTIAGILSPGASAGTLTFNDGLTLSGAYRWELGDLSTDPSDYDRVTVTSGMVNLTNAVLLLELGVLAPSDDSFWATSRSWNGIVNHTGADALIGSLTIANDQSSWSNFGTFGTETVGNDVHLVWTAVPEPDLAAMAGGLGFLLLLRRRRRA